MPALKHGLSGTKEYYLYHEMGKRREMCDEWDTVEKFHKDFLPMVKDFKQRYGEDAEYTMKVIDNDKPLSKDNIKLIERVYKGKHRRVRFSWDGKIWCGMSRGLKDVEFILRLDADKVRNVIGTGKRYKGRLWEWIDE